MSTGGCSIARFGLLGELGPRSHGPGLASPDGASRCDGIDGFLPEKSIHNEERHARGVGRNRRRPLASA